MTRVTTPDAIAFMLLEARRRPMHMSGLQVFTAPEGSGPEFVRRTYAAMRACADIAPMFAGRPVTVLGRPVIVGWTDSAAVDLDYHLRYACLPRPGGKSELFRMVSELHGRALDRRRPLWEVHVIDGFDDRRFAIFTKSHHALFDGVSFLSLLQRALSTDSHDTTVRVLWSQRPQPRATSDDSEASTSSAGTVALFRAAWRERELFPAFRAPRTMLNVRSEVPWVCATQPWPIQRIETVSRTARVSVNDVALAMCSGALRALLLDWNALPRRPLVGLSPVDLRTARDPEGRNVMSSAVCNLATHLEDPAERLRTIHASMRFNKQFLRALPRQVSMYLAGLIGAPITDGARPLQFNVGISYVKDAKEPRYHNGARLEGTFGFPPTLRGHALNIGLSSNSVSLNFAVVACARVLPSLDGFIDHLETSLKDLERAVGLPGS